MDMTVGARSGNGSNISSVTAIVGSTISNASRNSVNNNVIGNSANSSDVAFGYAWSSLCVCVSLSKV